MKSVWKKILIIIGIVLGVLLIALAVIMWPESYDLSEYSYLGEQYDVRILRDTWGVPHIYGETDADAAFGLAYAHSEDDFLTIQQSVLAAQGQLSAVYGMDGTANDYMVQLLRIRYVLDEHYESDLMPETKALMDAYANGLNYYAALHPDEILYGPMYPLSGIDIAAASVHKSPLFFGLDSDLGALFAEERQSEVSERLSEESPYFETAFGSNTIAVGPSRSSDGSTYFLVNSHQPWTGPVAWYEAHIHSNEGWNAAGALFPGVPSIVHGQNDDLAWAFTVNHADLTDVYVLEINPDNPYQYKYDGEWLNLEQKDAILNVRLLGRLRLDVKQEVLWSVYGPVVRQEHGSYAIRYANYGRVDIFEQLYRMNKAENYDEWLDAVKTQALPTFNIGYADKEGNIYYLYNAHIPNRNAGYDYSLYLPGNTSETNWSWDEYVAFEDLPQVLNPAAGFIQNANSTPFGTTLGDDNPVPEDYPYTYGIESYMTNRSLRAIELLGSDESITFDEFLTYKFDMQYSTESDVGDLVEIILAIDPGGNQNLADAIEIVRNWDFRVDPDNTGAAIIIYTLINLSAEIEDFSISSLDHMTFDPDLVKAALQNAADYLLGMFGKVDVTWSDVNRLIRGDTDLGLGGGPDVLHAVYGSVMDDGRLEGHSGDSYVMVIHWGPDGEMESFSIHQFGSATLDPDSPHYADQAELFVQRELKPVWMTEDEVLANLEASYRPGEELDH